MKTFFLSFFAVIAFVGFGFLIGIVAQLATHEQFLPLPNIHAATAPNNWMDITPPQINLANTATRIVAVDPKTPSTVYVSTSNSGLFKSTDSGQTWTKIDTGTNSSVLDSGDLITLALDPNNPTTMYTTSGYNVGGIWKSTDGGVDWVNILPSSIAQTYGSGIFRIAVDPTNSQHLLATFINQWGGTYGGDAGLIETLDGGNTWNIVPPPANQGWGTAEYPFFLTSTTWLVAPWHDGLWRTTDSGATWTKITLYLHFHQGSTNLYQSPTGALYMGSFSSVIRSTDDGVTWSEAAPDNGDGYGAVIGDGTNIYSLVATSPGDTQGPQPFIYTSEGSGTSWQTYNSQTFSYGARSMDVDKQNDLIYASLWNGGLWRLQGNATPTINASLTIPQPTITSANTYGDSITLSGTKDASEPLVYVNGSTFSVTYPDSTHWTTTLSLTVGTNSFTVAASDTAGERSNPSNVSIIRQKQGDINNDTFVNLTDLSRLAKDWHRGLKWGDSLYDPMSDQNADGNVDLTDLSMFAKSWGT